MEKDPSPPSAEHDSVPSDGPFSDAVLSQANEEWTRAVLRRVCDVHVTSGSGMAPCFKLIRNGL